MRFVASLLTALLVCCGATLGHAQLTMTGAGEGGAGGGGVAYATWNPADKNANITLSNSFRTVVGTGSNQSVRDTAAAGGSQKVYVEFVWDAGSGNPTIGFADLGESLSVRPGTSFAPDSFGIRFNGNLTFNQGGNGTWDGVGLSATGGVVGSNVSVAYDQGTQKMWVRVDGAAWNSGVAGSQDPAAGTGGVPVTGFFGEVYPYAILCIDQSDNQLTANFSPSSWTYAAPSGFTALQ